MEAEPGSSCGFYQHCPEWDIGVLEPSQWLSLVLCHCYLWLLLVKTDVAFVMGPVWQFMESWMHGLCPGAFSETWSMMRRLGYTVSLSLRSAYSVRLSIPPAERHWMTGSWGQPNIMWHVTHRAYTCDDCSLQQCFLPTQKSWERKRMISLTGNVWF